MVLARKAPLKRTPKKRSKVVDLFPGTGVMGRVVEQRTNQGVLAL